MQVLGTSALTLALMSQGLGSPLVNDAAESHSVIQIRQRA